MDSVIQPDDLELESDGNNLLAIKEKQIDKEDYEGISLNNAYNNIQYPQEVQWPNDAYCQFIEINTNYQLSNAASDAIIHFFNKFSNLDISPLPVSTQIGKEWLDNANIRYNMFKETSITMFQDIQYTLYYRPMIQAIKSLLAIDDVNQNLGVRYEEKWEMKDGRRHRVFEE